ncbi:TNT domain-containing protein [Mycobacterium sp. NBC_00419]|uniref:TNT domain-containing protein n=1 Tax=Mycobacterium sp. NBC_00419 TaxID=2975989 RepID=UPI002E1DA31C
MTLTVLDIERWNAGDVREVFHAATSRAQAAMEAADGLATLPAFETWGGQAAEAAKEAIGQTRRDLDAAGNEALAVANAAGSAADEIERIKLELASLRADAESLGMEIDPVAGTVLPGPKVRNPMEAELKQAQLQPRLDKIVAEANLIDMALANAINMAGGKVPIPPLTRIDGPGVPSTHRPSWPENHDQLNGGRAADPTPSVQDLLTGAGRPDAGGQPADVNQTLDRIAGVPAPVRVAKPVVFSAKEIEGFKATARRALASEGMSAEQIESALDGMVARAQAMGWDFPDYHPPEPVRMPAPGFGEGFGDAWRNTEQGIKNLLGQGGPGAPGVLESWKDIATGISDTVTNPVGAVVGEIQHAADSPSAAYYAGEKTFDFASVAATAPFGLEGAAVRAGLPAELVTEGGIPLSAMRGWDPLGGMHPTEFDNQFGGAGARVFPDNNGFPPGYVPQPAHLPAGTIIDRIGSMDGRYFAPDGTPFGGRAIMPESAGGEYNRYMLTGKPLPEGWQIVEGPIQPWFGQTPNPGVPQYMLVGPPGVKVSAYELWRRGIFDDCGPPLGR